MEMQPRISPFCALLWKEWWQQAWVFTAMFVLPAALVPLAEVWFPDVGPGVAAVVWSALVFALAANAFAGEQDDGTVQFLRALAVDRRRVYAVKLATVVGLSVLGAVPVLILSHEAILKSPRTMLEWIGPGLGLLVAAASVSALLAALGARALATFLAAAVLTVGVLISFVAGVAGLYQGVGLYRPLLVLLWLELALLVVGAAAAWCWREDRFSRRALAVAALAAVGVAAAVAPPMAAWGWILCLADPADYDRDGLDRSRWFAPPGSAVAYPSPAGRYVAVECWTGGLWWGRWGRIAIVDTVGDQARWCGRFRAAVLTTARPTTSLRPSSPWSPDGRVFLSRQSPQFPWPLPWRAAPGLPAETEASRVVVDPATGTATEYSGSAEDPLWCNGATLVTGWTASGVRFYDWQARTSTQCRLPPHEPPPTDASDYWSQAGTRTTAVGLFAWWPEPAAGPGRCLRVFRAAPDLADTEEKRVDGTWTDPRVRDVAEDGCWLLVEEGGDEPSRPDRFSLVSLADGQVRRIEPPAGQQLDAARGFLPGGRGVLFATPDSLLVVDLQAAQWRVLPSPPEAEAADAVGCRVSPSGRYLAVLNRDGGWWCVDLDAADSTTVERTDKALHTGGSLAWLGEDRLLVRMDGTLWIVNRDGTGQRRLLSRGR